MTPSGVARQSPRPRATASPGPPPRSELVDARGRGRVSGLDVAAGGVDARGLRRQIGLVVRRERDGREHALMARAEDSARIARARHPEGMVAKVGDERAGAAVARVDVGGCAERVLDVREGAGQRPRRPPGQQLAGLCVEVVSHRAHGKLRHGAPVVAVAVVHAEEGGARTAAHATRHARAVLVDLATGEPRAAERVRLCAVSGDQADVARIDAVSELPL